MHVSGTHFVARTYMHRVVAGAGGMLLSQFGEY